ncbi:hypothetical protein GQ457_17G015470 [Hibiscus cannabinus]
MILTFSFLSSFCFEVKSIYDLIICWLIKFKCYKINCKTQQPKRLWKLFNGGKPVFLRLFHSISLLPFSTTVQQRGSQIHFTTFS